MKTWEGLRGRPAVLLGTGCPRVGPRVGRACRSPDLSLRLAFRRVTTVPYSFRVRPSNRYTVCFPLVRARVPASSPSQASGSRATETPCTSAVAGYGPDLPASAPTVGTWTGHTTGVSAFHAAAHLEL